MIFNLFVFNLLLCIYLFATMSQPPTAWEELESANVKYNYMDPFSMNGYEFSIVTEYGGIIRIYKYNTKHNKWTKISDLHADNILNNDDWGGVFDKENQLFYFTGNTNTSLHQIDLKTNTIQLISKNIVTEVYPTMLIINHKIHILDETGQHLLFDLHNKSVTKMYQFESHYCPEYLLHMKSTNSMLMFGTEANDYSNIIYEFSLKNNKWHKWNVELPTNLEIYGSAVVLSTDEKYIFVLGGYIINLQVEKYCSQISVYDVQNTQWRSCSIKSPKEGRYGGLIINNEKDDELLVFGYINQLYCLDYFNNVQQMPHYLI
eukprot:108753_1